MFGLNSLLPNKIKSKSTSSSCDSKKRYRISTTQNNELEVLFKTNPRPCKEIQEEISKKIDLPYRTVTIWFQNRRAKAKLAGEPLAEHVFQWKPPVIAEEPGCGVMRLDKPEVKLEQVNGLNSNAINQDDTIQNMDAKSVYTVDSGCHIQDSASATNPNGIDMDMQAWASNQPFANPNWAQSTPVGRNSVDSGSFISDYSNYDGFMHQVEFDTYLASSNTMYDNGNTFNNLPVNVDENGTFDPSRNFMISQSLYAPTLSNSLASLSSQNSGHNSFSGEGMNANFMGQNGMYRQAYQMSAQSLPQFSNPAMGGSTNHIPQRQVQYHHSIQSAPEIALQQSLFLRQQHANQAQARAQAKLQRQRNEAMFSSMRY